MDFISILYTVRNYYNGRHGHTFIRTNVHMKVGAMGDNESEASNEPDRQ